MAKKIIDILINNNKLNSEYRDVYIYFLDRKVNEFICFILMTYIGTVLYGFINTFLFISIFKYLRRYTGGYHSKTRIRCILTSCIVLVLCLQLSIFLNNQIYILDISIITSTIILLKVSPLNNLNMSWTEEEMTIVNVKMLKSVIVILMCLYIIRIRHIEYFSVCVMSFVSVSMSVLIAKILNEEKKI